jgi:hypothetical protein
MKSRFSRLFIALTLLAGVYQVVAQNTMFTYQGRVLDNGTNFTSAGQFEFALVTSTNTSSTATATANLSGTFVTSYNLLYDGTGYTATPTVTISGGGGSGATATATISGGMVTAITPGSAGSGYTSTPTVTISPPPANITYATYWSNNGTSVNGSEPSAAVDVGVSNGLFTVVLGDTTLANMTAIPATIFAAQPSLQLRIWFNDGVNGFAALSPVQSLTPAPYAIMADSANRLPGLSVQQNTNGAPNLIGGSPGNFVLSGVVGATIGGGGTTNYSGNVFTNSVSADFGTVSGGLLGTASGVGATVGGGAGNTASGSATTVGGGQDNVASGYTATIGGGYGNAASGPGSFIGGGGYDGTIVSSNNIQAGGATIGGGVGNLILSGALDAFIGGGQQNTNSGADAMVAGGYENTASGADATVDGGGNNTASGYGAAVGGGLANTAGGYAAAVSGGQGNQANNNYATVPGGIDNIASGLDSFAAGQQAQALHQGVFVWADSQNAAFSSTSPNQFLIRAQGGVGINVNNPSSGLTAPASLNVQGGQTGFGNSFGFPVVLFQNTNTTVNNGPALRVVGGGGTNVYGALSVSVNVVPGSPNGSIATFGNADSFECVISNEGSIYTQGTVYSKGVALTSDRNAKENFKPVDDQAVLAKVASLPLTEWNYKTDSTGVQHIGPMAQDFQAVFHLDGADDKHISMVDEGGVALAAIQGLNQKLENEAKEKDVEIQTLKQQNDSLAREMNKLAATVKRLEAQK